MEKILPINKVTGEEYDQIHNWLRSTYGKAQICEDVECLGKGIRFEYALKSGESHGKLRERYITLCNRCHRKYDSKFKNYGHKVNYWRTIKVPENLWHEIRLEAAKHNRKIYEEISTKFNY